MEILPILHTSGQKQLAFWSLKSTPCRIYGGKKVDLKNTCTQFRLKVLAIIFYSIAGIIQRLIKMSGILTFYVFTSSWRVLHAILSWCVCTAYGCCTLKHENWKGQLARIGCRTHIMHKLDHFLLYFRQFTIRKSIWFVQCTVFRKASILSGFN